MQVIWVGANISNQGQRHSVPTVSDGPTLTLEGFIVYQS